MKILLVVATPLESALLRQKLAFSQLSDNHFVTQLAAREIHLVHTGIGMVNTAFSMGEFLANHRFDLLIHFGIAGSFDRKIKLGEVVEIVEDSFIELGAEDGEDWLTLEQMGFPLLVSPSFTSYGTLSNPRPSDSPIPKVTAITTNTVHGNEKSIERIRKKWNKQVETMEGAALFHAALKKRVPFVSFRGISNYVEPRDTSKWNMKESLSAVQEFVLEFIKNRSLST